MPDRSNGRTIPPGKEDVFGVPIRNVQRKRGIYGGDIIVRWVRADNSGADCIATITTEQDW